MQKDEFESPLFSLATVASATNNFSCANMIGEGGFGPVYKVINVIYGPRVEKMMNAII